MSGGESGSKLEISDQRTGQGTGKPQRWKRYALHAVRVALFASILLLIHWQHRQMASVRSAVDAAPIALEAIQRFYPNAARVSADVRPDGGREVVTENGDSLGFVVQTSPQADHLIGFSGPTNTLLAFDNDSRIIGVDILSSGDTRDHVQQVAEDPKFLKAYEGITWKEAAAGHRVDAVSHATLTSLTIQESIIERLSGERPSLRFPDPLELDDATPLFESAVVVRQDERHGALWHVLASDGSEVGTILRTSPAADNIVGYQGPTEARIGFNPGGEVIGISIGKTYDNEEYVTYVREEEYFLNYFNDLMLNQLADLDLEEYEVEGVSGATMTSMAVADGLLAAAKEHREAIASAPEQRESGLPWTLRDIGTSVVVIAGVVIALTQLRGNQYVRIGLQVVLIFYLGLINGDMISQAMIFGWAQNGIPWWNAGGLVLMTFAALAVPITTGRNAYCTHICPHGAAQQWLKNRLPWKARLPGKVTKWLKFLPVALLAWCIVVVTASLPYSLVDIEPFDAWVLEVAGWATITVAVVGLGASLFIPMAYCRFGCPTGAMLGFLRLHSRSDRWSQRDWFAIGLLGLAIGLVLLV